MKLSKLDILRNVLVEKQTTFLLGAGASAPFFSSLGNIEIILSDPNINPDAIKLIKVLFYKQSISDNSYLINYLDGVCYCGDKKKLMINIINEYTRFTHNLVEFMKLRNSRLSPKRTNIVTTNYDLFTETAIESILQDNNRIFYNDGAAGYINRVLSTENFNKTLMYSGVFDNYSSEMPAINLIKCHGSINWKVQRKTNERNQILVESKFQKITKINQLIKANYSVINQKINEYSPTLNHNEVKDLNDVVLMLNSVYTKELIDDINLLGDATKDLLSSITSEIEQLQIVLPTKRKFQTTLIEEQYFNMLRFLSYELEKEQSVLIAFGFSFFDEHITDIVQRSLNNPNLLVIIFCYEDKNKAEIVSRFTFSDHTIPSNVLFITPKDFLLETIDLNDFEADSYYHSNYLKFSDRVEIYDNKINFHKRKSIDANNNSTEYYFPVIDFAVFNNILEEDLSNKYISKYQYGENADE